MKLPFYNHDSTVEVILTNAEEGLKSIEEWIGDKKFLVGGNVTWVDFYFFEILCKLNRASEGKLLAAHPILKAYHEVVLAIPQIKAYRTGPKWENLWFNNKIAKINMRDPQ